MDAMRLAEMISLVVASYLLGSLPFGYWIGLSRGVNVLEEGSHNPGASNVDRVLGKPWGTIVLLTDVGKAMLPVLYAKLVMDDPILAVYAGEFALLGHCFSPFLKGKGGKGVACFLGVGLATSPWITVGALLLSKLTKSITGHVSMGSMVGVASLATALAFMHLPPEIKIAFGVMAIIVILRHHSNIKRLIAGTEPKEERKMQEMASSKAGFTVNPETSDPDYFRNKLGKVIPAFKKAPDWLVLVLRWLIWFIPMGSISGICSGATGQICKMYYLAIAMTPEEMDLNRFTRWYAIIRITMAIIFGRLVLGVKGFGLGGHTSIVTNQGKSLRWLRVFGVHITTGNSETTDSAVNTGIKVIKWLLGMDPRTAKVAILGAGGSIGWIAARILAHLVGELVLVGRAGGTDLEPFVQKLQNSHPSVKISHTTDLKKGLQGAHLVIAATSNKAEIPVEPDWFTSGCVVIDVARPRAFGKILALRRDVLVLAGGIFKAPGEFIKSSFSFGLRLGELFACMTETVLVEMEKIHEWFSLGKELEIKKVLRMGWAASRHGFRMVCLRSTDDEDIDDARLREFLKTSGLGDQADERIAAFKAHMEEYELAAVSAA